MKDKFQMPYHLSKKNYCNSYIDFYFSKLNTAVVTYNFTIGY